jgi:hypothetical protein
MQNDVSTGLLATVLAVDPHVELELVFCCLHIERQGWRRRALEVLRYSMQQLTARIRGENFDVDVVHRIAFAFEDKRDAVGSWCVTRHRTDRERKPYEKQRARDSFSKRARGGRC